MLESKDIISISANRAVCMSKNRKNLYRLNLSKSQKIPSTSDTLIFPPATMAVYFPKSKIYVFANNANMGLFRDGREIRDWKSCYICDPFKFIKKDTFNKLLFSMTEHCIVIVDDIEFKQFEQHRKRFVHVNVGGKLHDFTSVGKKQVIAALTEDAIVALYSYEGQLIRWVEIAVAKARAVISINACVHGVYLIVSTSSKNYNFPVLTLLKYQEETIIRELDNYDFRNDNLSTGKSSYFYDVNMDLYAKKYPLIVAPQCHFDRKIFIFSVVDEKLFKVDSFKCQYSNVRSIKSNGVDTVAVVGSNQVLQLVKFVV